MLAKDILEAARFNLSDTDKQRWTDKRLLILLNNALTDITKNTILLTKKLYVGIYNLVADYDLSSQIFKIDRIEYLNTPLLKYTYDQMDAKNINWQTDTGTKPTAFVYDKQNQGQFRLYPIIDSIEANPHITFSSSFGIITDISYSDFEPFSTDTFGDLGSFEDTGYLVIFYTPRITAITDINTDIDIPEAMVEPISRYISGYALRDNTDTQNRTVGLEDIQLYEKAIEEYRVVKSESFGNTNYEVEYRSI